MSVDFQYEFGKLENVKGRPTEVGFTSPCTYKTLVRCYTEKNGGGYMSLGMAGIGGLAPGAHTTSGGT
jgi:hypothetical protein